MLSDIHPIRPTWFHAFFDCLAYHHVPLQTLECHNLYNYKHRAEVNKFGGLAAHLKYGNFPNLSSLAIHEYMMTEGAAAALIDGFGKGCRAVTRLALGCECSPPDSAERGLLLQALSRASGNDVEISATSMKPLHSLQTLCLDWSSLTSAEVFKFLFDLNIHTKSNLLLPRSSSIQESDFHQPFPSLLSLDVIRCLKGLPLETGPT